MIHEPAGGGVPQSILPSDSYMGLGFGNGFGGVFCGALGFCCAAFPAVLFALLAGSRLVLVLAPRLAVASLVLNVGSHVVLILFLRDPSGGRFVFP